MEEEKRVHPVEMLSEKSARSFPTTSEYTQTMVSQSLKLEVPIT